MKWRMSRSVDLHTRRIGEADGDRQMTTGREILRRLRHQPGLILADEVGMGKTFVALAVAASVVEETQGRQPVVVMVPNSVREKWPREWDVFRRECLRGKEWIRATSTTARRGAEFLRLLDDPEERRHHIVFLTHGALTNSLQDPFVKLAIVRRAFFRRTSLKSQRRALPRWSQSLFRDRRLSPQVVRKLLDTHPSRWKSAYERTSGRTLDDDPVPEAVIEALEHIDLTPLVDALSELPVRSSAHLDERLRETRSALQGELQALWSDCLNRLHLRLPLLIFDEAHHLKNARNRYSGLFATAQAEKDADEVTGPLAGVFERMLFMTATPFQLGHHELLSVLDRFDGIRWSSVADRRAFAEDRHQLLRVLDGYRASALRLDQAWGRLRPGDVGGVEADDAWWERPDDETLPDTLRMAARHVDDAATKMRRVEKLLRPWVIRHTREAKDERRTYLAGSEVVPTGDGSREGLAIQQGAVLPFLLAARAQGLVATKARRGVRSRAYFSEGLASSFEAFKHTRGAREAALDEDAAVSDDTDEGHELAWYLREIDQALPAFDPDVWANHPKIAATVSRALHHWVAGEKVLIFCFYIHTGRALRNHLSRRVQASLVADGAWKLDLQTDDQDEIIQELDRQADRFFDPDAPVTRVAREALHEIFGAAGVADADLEETIDAALRFVRTPAFLVRYVDVSKADQAAAFNAALDERDGSGESLRERLERFGEFTAERVPEERSRLLDALRRMPTGRFHAPPDADAQAEVEGRRDRVELLPNVRLANGQVKAEARERLMLTFNTPFFPDILIASAVMAEGVDLHLDCRHVIHHDLDWNPSVLEQRTGRVDRIGCKADRSAQPILVCEPYVSGTHDEKQFKVVKDRDRWFNVVMGGQMELDEWSTERIEERVPLPSAVAEELTLDLAVARPDQDA